MLSSLIGSPHERGGTSLPGLFGRMCTTVLYPHVCSTEDTLIPRGTSAYPVIRTRPELKATKKTHILISAALNTFTHQRKRTQKCFNLSYLLKIPLFKNFHILQQIWLYYFVFYFHSQMVFFHGLCFLEYNETGSGHRKTEYAIFGSA